MRLKVTDTAALARVLDGMGVEYTIWSDSMADLYASPNVTHLAAALAGENCEILSIQELDESLESYYVNLLGGDGHG